MKYTQNERIMQITEKTWSCQLVLGFALGSILKFV